MEGQSARISSMTSILSHKCDSLNAVFLIHHCRLGFAQTYLSNWSVTGQVGGTWEKVTVCGALYRLSQWAPGPQE